MSSMTDWKQAMSAGYWERWNDSVQAKIDQDIEHHRKADGIFRTDAPKGADIKVEQISSSFIFGAHIFNFDQLGTDERNAKYRALYGTLFNSATIAFYWKTLEPIEGQPRFEPSYRDTPTFWNSCPNPKEQPHWRRPAVDPVVDFCLSKGIRLHGHTLVWGSNTWQYPDWLIGSFPLDVLKHAKLDRNPKNGQLLNNALAPCIEEMTADEFADRYPEFTSRLNTVIAKRIIDIAMRYGDRIDSWDVVNESASDYGYGRMVPGSRICKSWYGPMPGDYTYRAFKIAESVFPNKAKLNINEYNMSDDYLHQVQDLLARGCKIDIMGAQMHLFDPQICLDIADGKTDRESPEMVYEKFTRLAKANLPIHLSEITITAPNNDERGQAIQAVIAHNLYRLWFSLEPMMGITWWNVVDDCGAPGEPSVSGLFSRDMAPKPAYFALENLINHEWRTNLCTQADEEGRVSFRGFRGNYKLTWLDAQDKEHSQIVTLA
ncbi:MAG: endo-1,4-beta-xylanase [Victivallales bacterium]|nr:endo-1,4-beta-xylanase [Victivallales bacterium]